METEITVTGVVEHVKLKEVGNVQGARTQLLMLVLKYAVTVEGFSSNVMMEIL